MCVFQRAFVSDAEDNVVKELSSTEQRCLLHFGFEVDREPEDFYWETFNNKKGQVIIFPLFGHKEIFDKHAGANKEKTSGNSFF